MENVTTALFSNQTLIIIGATFGFLWLATMFALFIVSRRTQKVMQSLLMLITRPERAKIQDATRVLQTLMGDEMAKLDAGFQKMRETLAAQIESAGLLKRELTEQNDKLIATADEATKKLVQMSQRLDNTVDGLNGIVDSDSWSNVADIADKFNSTVGDLLTKIDTTANDTTERVGQIQAQIDGWISAGETLSESLKTEFENNTTQMANLTAAADTMQTKIADIAHTTAQGFTDVKTAAADYESIMDNNKKLLADHLNKLDTYTKQSTKQMNSQVKTLTTTANVVAGQIRLSETALDMEIAKLAEAAKAVSASGQDTADTVRTISKEMTDLTKHFNGEIKDFATGVVAELKTVSGVANTTLENTKTSATAFSDSVKAMASGVRETLIEMNTAHTQLTGQSEGLIKMSAETTAQLQPLSELIEKYYTALPDLSRGSVEAAETLEHTVASLNEKINLMKATVSESTEAIGQSALKLEDFAGQSRQQMIDLMSDYAKAVDTMQTLNKQMMVARATAPMDAIKSAPATNHGYVSSSDFLKQSERALNKLHELSLDLTRAIGAEIPDVVWKKYHDGDAGIFSKWLAKMLVAADKKRIREMLKSDAVFRSQATQFVRSFDKVMGATGQTDNPDSVSAALLKTDLGRVYSALKGQI